MFSNCVARSIFWQLWKKKKSKIFIGQASLIVSAMQRQLENLGAQRAGLEDMLKEMKRKV